MRKKGIAQLLTRSVVSLYEAAKTRVRVDSGLELNESTERNSWSSLQDTSTWWATNSEECDVAVCR